MDSSNDTSSREDPGTVDDPPATSMSLPSSSPPPAARVPVSVSSPQIAIRREGSDASLSGTMEYYNTRRRSTTLERGHSGTPGGTGISTGAGSTRPSSQGLTAGPPNSRPTSSFQPTVHSASILPSASFFNPKRPSRAGAYPANVITSSSFVPGSSVRDNRGSLRVAGGLDAPRRTGNGPLITRISSDFSNTSQGMPAPVWKANTTDVVAEDGEVGRLEDGRSARMSRSDDALSPRESSESARPKATATTPSSPHRHSGSRASLADPDASTIQISIVSPPLNSRNHTRDASSSSVLPPEPSSSASADDHHSTSGGLASQPSREPLLMYSADSPTGAGKPPHARSPSEDTMRSRGRSVEAAVQRARDSLHLSRAGSVAGGAGGAGSPVQILDEPEMREIDEAGRKDLRTTVEKERLSTVEKGLLARPPSAQKKRLSTKITLPTLPVTDADGRRLRNHELHAGANRFFLGGHVLTSRQSPAPFLACLVLAFALPAMFLGFSGPFLWRHLGGGGKASIFVFAYLACLMIVNMCVTAWRDPGILPRGLDKPERKWVEDAGNGVGGWKAEPKFMRFKEGVVASKWCETCETYRPPRTSHCRLCDSCIASTDHHCSWLNNCIGRRNYTSFIAFLISSIICCSYAVAFSAYHISARHEEAAGASDWAARWDVGGSFVVAVLCFLLLLPITGLFSYHLRLLFTNHTTIEMLRPKFDRSGGIDPATGQATGNLFALHSPWSNMVALLCRPMGAESWLSAHSFAEKDAREELLQGQAQGQAT